MNFSRTRALFCTLLVAAALPAFATTVVAPRFEALVDGAELIFTGQALTQRSEWRNQNGQRVIVTLVTFGVEQIYKGRASHTVTLQFLGGTVGDVTLEVAEVPRFKNGERAVLFVAGNGAAVSPVLGFFHGRFPLRRRADGTEEVLRYNGEKLGVVDEIGRVQEKAGAGTRHALSHEGFAARIRERVRSGAK